ERFSFFFFFFQAEDGIRDGHVTGVQTCALPISSLRARSPKARAGGSPSTGSPRPVSRRFTARPSRPRWRAMAGLPPEPFFSGPRSEERRVGKECGGRWGGEQWKKREEREGGTVA